MVVVVVGVQWWSEFSGDGGGGGGHGRACGEMAIKHQHSLVRMNHFSR
jgi:hypothetical protein